MDPTTRELITQARRPDPAAFSRLITLYERTCLSIAFSILNSAPAAGDAAQDAFLKAWQRLPDLKDSDSFPAWLARIVRNTSLDARRRRPAPAHDVSSLSLPITLDPSADLEKSETAQHLDAALSHLDDETRTILTLRYYDNLSPQQIATLLDLAPSAVYMRLSRARDQLRHRLTQTLQPGEHP